MSLVSHSPDRLAEAIEAMSTVGNKRQLCAAVSQCAPLCSHVRTAFSIVRISRFSDETSGSASFNACSIVYISKLR